MFIAYIFGAAAILIIQSLNKLQLYQPTIGYYYRYGTSLQSVVSDELPIERKSSIVYQLKQLISNATEVAQECSYLEFFHNSNGQYIQGLKQIKQAYLFVNSKHKVMYSVILNYYNVMTIYQTTHPDVFDQEYYGFNQQIQWTTLYEQIIEGTIISCQYLDKKNVLVIMFKNQHNNIFHFQLGNEFRIMSFQDKDIQIQHVNLIVYQQQQYVMVISRMMDHNQFISLSIQKVERKISISSLRFIKNSELIWNIPLNDRFNLINMISIGIDEMLNGVRLTIVSNSIQFTYGHTSSYILLQEDITKEFALFKNNVDKLVKYVSDSNVIYVIIANTLHFIIIPTAQERHRLVRINIPQSRNFNPDHEIVNMRMHKYILVLQSYDYNTQSNQFYYADTSQLSSYLEAQSLNLLKLEDWKQTLSKSTILDYHVVDNVSEPEIIFLLSSGDIVIGTLHLPLYMQLYEYLFGDDGYADDVDRLRGQTSIWFGITIVLVVFKYLPIWNNDNDIDHQ